MPFKSKKSLPEMGEGWDYVKGVKSIEFYARDAKVSYGMRGMPQSAGRGRGRKITEFTKDSRMKLAFVANNTQIGFEWMITLTYPGEFETDGKEVKKHLGKFLSWMRGREMGVQYLWFLEFQKRGAPHFHILVDRAFDKNRVSAIWYKHVASGDKRHLAAGTRVERIRKQDGARRYVVKYAQKMKQKEVPDAYQNVGRFWGNSAGVKPLPIGSVDMDMAEPVELVQAMNFWDYQATLVKRPLKTLYGVSGYAWEIIGSMIGEEVE